MQPGAFAEDEAVAVAVEGAAGVGRVVVPLRKGPHGGERAEADVRQGGLAAAGDDHVGLVAADELEGVADGVGGAGAGGDDHLVRAAQPVLDRQLRLAALPISLGMVKAETLSGPFSSNRWCWISIVSRPPMPEPRITPQRQGFSFEKSMPESPTALTPLTWANCTKRSNRLTSLASM